METPCRANKCYDKILRYPNINLHRATPKWFNPCKHISSQPAQIMLELFGEQRIKIHYSYDRPGRVFTTTQLTVDWCIIITNKFLGVWCHTGDSLILLTRVANTETVEDGAEDWRREDLRLKTLSIQHWKKEMGGSRIDTTVVCLLIGLVSGICLWWSCITTVIWTNMSKSKWCHYCPLLLPSPYTVSTGQYPLVINISHKW